MKQSALSKLMIIVLSAALAVTACKQAPQTEAESAVPAITQQVPKSGMLAESTKYSFRCESGKTIEEDYFSEDSIKVRYEDKTHTMQQVISASGVRYVGDGLEWWSKGRGADAKGMLSHVQADGTSGDIIERCVGS